MRITLTLKPRPRCGYRHCHNPTATDDGIQLCTDHLAAAAYAHARRTNTTRVTFTAKVPETLLR